MITKSIKLDRRRAPRRRAGHDPSRGGGARASCAPLPLIRKSESLSARIFAPLATWPGRGLGGLFVSGTAVGNLQTSSTNSTAGPRGAGGPAPRASRGVSRSCSRCGERRARPGVSPSRPARRPARGKWSRHDTHAHGHVGQDPGASSSSSYRLHTHATRMSQRPSSFFARSARANLRFRSRKPLFVGHAASAAPHRDDIISP